MSTTHPQTKGEFETLRVQFISLVKHPANRRPILYKSDGKFDLEMRIIKNDTAKKLIYGVVYEPDLVDTQDDFAKADLIQGTAHEFMRMGLVNMVDEQHNFEPGKGKIVESFILRGEDPHFPGVVVGAWCVVIEPTDEVAKRIESGEIAGLSLAGQGTYKKSAEIISQVRLANAEPHVRFLTEKFTTSQVRIAA